jgi:DNA-binding GntR family transcriptional regulator
MATKKSRRTITPPEDDPGGMTGLEPYRFIGLQEVEQSAARQILDAIADRRLPPGTKLAEDELSRIFDVSRERVRRILLVLSQHGIVQLEPNRGAFVAVPTIRERHDAFQLRNLLERHVVTVLCAQKRAVRTSIVKSLRSHIADEREAIAAGDRALQVRLSGDFHLKLAAFTSNLLLLRALRDVMTRMSLALAAQSPLVSELDCSINEHQPLVDAIEAGDTELAVRLMQEHLAHVESNFLDPGTSTSPLERAFRAHGR